VTLALYGLSALAVVLAWALVRRWPYHRAVALLLTVQFVADGAQRALQAWVLDGAARPYVGTARLTFEVQRGAWLSWPFSVLALAVWAFARRRPWLVVAAWALSVVALAALYPALRGAPLARVYLVGQGAMVAAGLVLWIRYARSGAVPLSPQIVAAWAVIIEAAVLVGPFARGLWMRWPLAQAAYMLFFVVVVAMHGRWLWTLSRR
jgi:hypothetical protein